LERRHPDGKRLKNAQTLLTKPTPENQIAFTPFSKRRVPSG
jgi:hypothetical protein